MKKIIIVFVALLYIFCIPVFASDEDILKESVKEKEENIIDDKDILKETDDINNTKAAITDPLLADKIGFIVTVGSSQYMATVKVSTITLGTKYRIYISGATSLNWSALNGYVCYPEQGYFVRGEEVLNDPITWNKENSVTYNGKISSFYSASNGTVSNYAHYEAYIEPDPTPEPTPDPTPDPTPEPTPDPEEPEIDPETISGNEILREILRTNRSILKNVENINELLSNNRIFDSNVSGNAVSDNIIHKKLEDYNTSESLALIGLVLGFGALLVYVIHKSVFKIRR